MLFGKIRVPFKNFLEVCNLKKPLAKLPNSKRRMKLWQIRGMKILKQVVKL
jgi:hypothetical protein